MQKVVGVNLNGVSYQIEQQGYERLLAYLDLAQQRLASNPDRVEIVADLEQAIAEKCNGVLGPHKTVVTTAEVDRILEEMGPVESDDLNAAAADPGRDQAEEPVGERPAPKRLYQIRDGAMISGVCNGIAAYVGIDVTIVRIAFVLLAVITRGIWLAMYGVLMFVIPYAETPEARAAAHGRPFNAQELIDQAKRNYAAFKNDKQPWRRQWRRQRREWKRQWRSDARGFVWNQNRLVVHPLAGATAPIFGLVHAALALTLVFALISLARTDTVFGYVLPEGLPRWAGFLLLIGIYQVLASPLLFARRAAIFAYPPGPVFWIAPGIGVLWLGVLAFGLWYGYHHVPELRELLDKLPGAWDAFTRALQ